MSLVPGEPGTLVRDAAGGRRSSCASLTKALGHPRPARRLRRRPTGARRPAPRRPAAVVGERPRPRARSPPPPRTPPSWRRSPSARLASAHDLAARLAAIAGVRVWPGAANFVLVAVADGPGVVAALRAPGHRRAAGRVVPRPRRAPPSHHGAGPGTQRAGGTRRWPRRSGRRHDAHRRRHRRRRLGRARRGRPPGAEGRAARGRLPTPARPASRRGVRHAARLAARRSSRWSTSWRPASHGDAASWPAAIRCSTASARRS